MIRAAREFGQLPHEYAARTPHRLSLVYQAWMELQWNRPDRSDHYAMLIAQKIGGGTLDKYKIPFKFEAQVSTVREDDFGPGEQVRDGLYYPEIAPMTKEQIAAVKKAVAQQRLMGAKKFAEMHGKEKPGGSRA